MNLKKTCQLDYSKGKKKLLAQTMGNRCLGYFHVCCSTFMAWGCGGGCVVVVDGHVKVAADVCGSGGSDGGIVLTRQGGWRCSMWQGCKHINKLVVEKCMTMLTSANGPCSHCFTFKYLTFLSFRSISFLLYN